MLTAIFNELGTWNWIVLGLVLLALEIVVPGVFLLWIGIAALITGGLSLLLANPNWWGWEVQVVVFLALSLVAAYAGRRTMGNGNAVTDEPLLNRRAEQMIGRTATLDEAITEHRGRIRLGDTLWRVTGPDLPVGARVRVSGARDGELTVEPI